MKQGKTTKHNKGNNNDKTKNKNINKEIIRGRIQETQKRKGQDEHKQNNKKKK